MKTLISLVIAAIAATAQVTYTPATAPVAAKPATLTATAGTVICTLTGDAVPAANITIACQLNSTIKISSYSIPVTLTATAYTFQYNFGGHALTVIINGMTLPVNVTATVDATAPVGGIF